MSILRGSLIAKSSLNLQSSLALLPWLKRNCNVRCSKHREYGSSAPVRYIPKKLRESGGSESFSAAETKSPNKRPKSQEPKKPSNLPRSNTLDYDKFDGSSSDSSRHETRDAAMQAYGCGFPKEKLSPKVQKSFKNLHMDEKPDVNEEIGYGMGSLDSQFMEEIEEMDDDDDDELEVSNVYSHGEQRLEKCQTKEDAMNITVRLLAQRAYTIMELRKKLQAKQFPLSIINGVLSDLQERGIINDKWYAVAFSRSKWSSSSWGPRRIKHALFMKGINQTDAEKAVKEVFDVEEDADHDCKLSISKVSLDQLYTKATKQWLKSKDISADKRKARIARWLQYRGFDWGIVSIILKKLEAQLSPVVIYVILGDNSMANFELEKL